ncbi:endoplasmic reticulum membrane sensor NFE2L1b isoform X1 [Poecilia latipinna]|uniref:endoplasmic reticulum membrane sensor NFE2L1b isoform X1 n=1 Tax=Poecilia latipinna TaxID=48699 RepID=UPI00072DBCED|nr:PREDICTED: nuclear factor erythroid 2-related factor 1 isoform X1 [Poecilia latipinna]XP_014884582.1 PREDICTED: nuclear factor erythroid 2-related factor 1 isoform X1 [Poecilia latipinna]XP_014884583.1 PREDICTED: nuclear factor erythroid 2-related factor 1 isoform X1 [Poecilia latipinna]XP_014884584.1 PREDICTED: nuclear factor erythroid 2-related factor 1 isoform X1 [Poecilia latipinna]XP_014884585.1 PREDICTED: nuclear factor erythroid 2-related factor 1 isoform X1 [Poecilia latipinna]
MLYLKKYFTEGLIQFTILLSLIGVRVDVDTYLSNQLPPLREIILGPSSAYTQTQFHNLRNTLDGYGIHPKSVDLDQFFTTRRLLNEVRQLDRLSVPSTELNTWLVHRDSETVVSAGGQSSPGITLDNGAGLEDINNIDATPAMRGGGGAPESTYDLNAADSSLGAVAPDGNQEQGSRGGNDDLTKEDIDLIDILWRQDIDLGAGREVFSYSNRQKDTEEEKPSPQDSKDANDEQESWRNGINLQGSQPVDGETGESIPEQPPVLGSQTSLSLQECLRLLEATFPFGEEAEFPVPVGNQEASISNEEVPSTSQGLALAPQMPPAEPQLDLEQQWQDIMAIMELQAMDVNNSASNSGNASSGTAEPTAAGTFGLSERATPINQDVSLHQASLPSCSQDFPQIFSPQLDSVGVAPRTGMLRLSSGNSTNINSTFGATNLTGVFLPPINSSSSNVTSAPSLPDPFTTLLEESMLDEISLLDLAMEEGFSQAQASQLEEELDSDSGLSLDSSRSPASPSSSETSCSSAASSSSTSANFSEEGAVGYSTDSEAAAVETEEGAVGGYQPEYSKLCRMSFQDLSQFNGLPQLDGISHNHTYNVPLSSSFPERPDLLLSAGKKASRDKKLQPSQDLLDKHSSRDERRARAMKIPFSNDKIVNLPVEEFNELLAKHHLSEAQLALIRDIRRRGKNKMAAQNCRKRKLETIINLEQGVQDLRRDKARLLKEKMEFIRSIRQLKQKMQSLCQEVFSQLRDEEGRPFPPSEYCLQYGADGSVLIAPRGGAPAAQQPSRKPEKKQKDKKK